MKHELRRGLPVTASFPSQPSAADGLRRLLSLFDVGEVWPDSVLIKVDCVQGGFVVTVTPAARHQGVRAIFARSLYRIFGERALRRRRVGAAAAAGTGDDERGEP